MSGIGRFHYPFIIALCSLSCASSTPRLSRSELDGAFRAGLQVFETGEHATALQRFRLVRAVDPDYPRLQHYMGLCYAKLGLPGFAVEALRAATKAEPQNRDIKLDLAVALEMARLVRGAEGLYLELLEADPSDARVVLNLGLLYVKRFKDVERGRVQLERYLKLEPESPDAPAIRKWLNQRTMPLPAQTEQSVVP